MDLPTPIPPIPPIPMTPSPYEGTVYRNIFTCSPTQDLLDDVCDIDDFGLVDTLIQGTSGIEHGQPQINRVFQYGRPDPDLLSFFERQNWNKGRFGDGRDYGVWYASEDERTSIYESCWSAYRIGRDNVLSRGEVYTVDRQMYNARISASSALDLIGQTSFYDRLTSEDYSFCQALGEKIHEEKFEMLRTPSARKKGGVCTPVFSPEIIKTYSKLYYLKFYLNPDGLITVSSSREGMSFAVQANDLTNLTQR